MLRAPVLDMRLIPQIGLSLFFGIAVSAYSLGTHAASSAEPLRLGLTSFPPARGNPFFGVTATSRYSIANIYDSFIAADNDGELHPALALSWRMRDPLTWEFQLRPGVTFSNGELWDAEGAKAVLDYMRSDKGSGFTFANDLKRLREVIAEDSLTLVIKLEAPNVLLPNHLLFVYFPAPQHLREVGHEGLSMSPVGTGSYALEEWGPGQLSLRAFQGSWREPLVQHLEIIAIPEPTSRENALLTNQVDAAIAMNPDQVGVLERAGIRVVQRAPQRITAMIFDTISEDSPFHDARVRQAMNYAVNRQAISQALLDGRVKPASQPSIEAALGFNPDLEPYPHDPDKARALLIEAGYPDGFSFTYEFAPGTIPNDAAIMQQVASDLAVVDVKMTIQPLTFVQFARNISQGGWRGHAWAMDYAGYFYDALKPFYQSLHSCYWQAPWYCDPEVDQRVKAAAGI